MIILFGSHYGRDTSELESGYLIWIIEKYEDADWSLINACKQELAARLKLDWHNPTHPEILLQRKLTKSENRITELENRCRQLTDLLGISILTNGNTHLIGIAESCPTSVQEMINGYKLHRDII